MTVEILRTSPEGAGPARPSGLTPPLLPGTLRRTSTIDVSRPDGVGGLRHLDGRARDVVGVATGVRELRSATLGALVDPDAVLRSLEVAPDDPHGGGEASKLVGAIVGPGFRARAAEHFTADRQAGTPLWTLLDDLPPTMLVSNYAWLRAGFQPPWVGEGGSPPKADICAGWQSGGTMIQTAIRERRQPVTFGPAAPRVEVDDHPEAWHAVDPLPPIGSRRRRRLDVVAEGDRLLVDAMFRDTYASEAGEESIVHEYAVRLHVDAGSLEVLEAVADPHVLPFVECPAAVGSADRIVGWRLDRLRDDVREEFVGITTCTHLNDLLRSMEDVVGLLAEQRA